MSGSLDIIAAGRNTVTGDLSTTINVSAFLEQQL
jgi:hypothetical protein